MPGSVTVSHPANLGSVGLARLSSNGSSLARGSLREYTKIYIDKYVWYGKQRREKKGREGRGGKEGGKGERKGNRQEEEEEGGRGREKRKERRKVREGRVERREPEKDSKIPCPGFKET